MIRLDVTLPGGVYPIMIDKDILPEAARLLPSYCPGGKAGVISDENVWRLHGARLKAALRESGIALREMIVPPGESSKSMERLTWIYGELHRNAHKRNDPIIAFGGGVVGDLAGFAAATYMRGVPLIQVPTTLLAQVDSSVGGKVAINLKEGKNLAGSFYQPVLVLAGTQLLSTLPKREWDAGMAEVIKYAALGENELLALLEEPERVPERAERMIYLCCRCKAGFVERDERDTGERMMLNFGHTFAHAIERYHEYRTVNHGEAVAIGMALAARTGSLLGLSEPGTEERLLRLMATHGLDCRLRDDIDQIIALMGGDKKNTGRDITLVLLKKMGEPFLHTIAMADLLELWKGGGGDGRGEID